ERVARALANADGPAWAGELVTPAINLVINTGLLMLAFMTIPTTRVTFRSALVGAVVAGTLFEAAKALFGLYLQSGGVERLYGAVALLPLFLLWVYVTWVIVLLGLQIAHAMQHFNTWVERTAAGPDDGMIVDPAVGVAVATLLARGFASGTSVRQEQIESTTGMPAGVVSKVVERLVDAGIAHRIAADEDDSTAALARSPDSILVADVLAAAERLDRSAANDDTGTVALLLSERRKAVGTETLASLIARNPVAAGRATTSGGPAGSPAAPHQPENSSVARAEEQG
ncbi:MAG: YhjD/YihY/BrkB family envelope integrity protein, partial [Planctomycetota bacterium]